MPNTAFERAVKHRGPRLAAAEPSSSAAELNRYAAFELAVICDES